MPISLVPHPDHYYQTEAEIFNKIKAGVPLSEYERYMHCNCLPDNALLHHNCYDELYARLYWQARPQFRQEIIWMKQKGENRLRFETMVYEELLKDWERELAKPNVANPLLKKSHEETNNELRQLARETILSSLGAPEIQRRRYEIISWSKYRYISAKMIADILFTNGEYEASLDNSKIILDLDGLMHIITGHFGARLKLYTHSKSHFTQDFYHEDLPLQLQAIFSRIDATTLYSGQLNNKNAKLVFGFKGTIYELFFRRIGGNRRYRVKTFYPANEDKTREIIASHTQHIINRELSFFASVI